jgi:hypothetical protein
VRKTCSILLSLLLLPLAIAAQSAINSGRSAGAAVSPAAAAAAAATLHGTVTDPSGAVIIGGTVELAAGVSSTALQTQITGSDGHYSFANIPPGSYVIRVKAGGFADFVSRPATVSAARRGRWMCGS